MAAYIIIAFAYLAPLAASAQNIWKGARCGGDVITDGGPIGACDFCDMVIVVSNIIDYALQFAVLIAIAMIVYGGLLMVTSAGRMEAVSKGKSRIIAAVVGLAVALVSWLVVNEIFHLLATGGAAIPWASIQC